ncbi:MAG: hypothetical protein ACK5VU_06220 [Burkholderiales bacterium]|jgi:hypothetical protein
MQSKFFVGLAIAIVSLSLRAQTSVIYLKCTLTTTSSGSKFATRTTENTTAMMVDLTTGRVSGGGAASFLSESRDFAAEVTDFEIKGSGRGAVTWMGSGGKLTRGGFKINRVTGDYFSTYRYEFDDGTYTENLENGNCVAAQKAF